MNDPIVEEVRQIRDAHAARFHYDLDAIFQDIKEQEKQSGHQFVSGASRPAMPKQVIQQTAGATLNATCGTSQEVMPAAEFERSTPCQGPEVNS